MELRDSDGDLDTKKRMAKDLLELWSAPRDLRELLELVESRADWQDTFLPEYRRWAGEMT